MQKLYNWALSVIGIMTVFIIFYVGPRVETLMFPVVTDFKIEHIKKLRDGSTEISGIMLKQRGECEPVPGSLTAFTEYFVNDDDHPSKEVHIRLEPLDKWNSRPQGSQYWGPWLLTPPVPPLGPLLVIRIKHRCHPFWDTDTVLYSGPTKDFFTQKEIIGDN